MISTESSTISFVSKVKVYLKQHNELKTFALDCIVENILCNIVRLTWFSKTLTKYIWFQDFRAIAQC